MSSKGHKGGVETLIHIIMVQDLRFTGIQNMKSIVIIIRAHAISRILKIHIYVDAGALEQQNVNVSCMKGRPYFC